MRSADALVMRGGAVKVDPTQDFDAFYTATYRNLVGQIYAVCGSMAEAEDAVQEAYARAWQRWGKVGEYDEPAAWVRTVAYRLVVSAWRKSVNRLFAHHRERVDGEVPGLNPDHLALVSALRRISADQRMAIVLYHFAGLSVNEIATQTGSRTSAVKARLARGRKALAEHVSESVDTAAEGRPAKAAALRETNGEEI
jgi:RNA polymerase sigma-70 factor (sigma-E family)